ncbi:MAG: hypothetical protein ACRDD7_11220 [Peptostreptococcaceae bacterium]
MKNLLGNEMVGKLLFSLGKNACKINMDYYVSTGDELFDEHLTIRINESFIYKIIKSEEKYWDSLKFEPNNIEDKICENNFLHDVDMKDKEMIRNLTINKKIHGYEFMVLVNIEKKTDDVFGEDELIKSFKYVPCNGSSIAKIIGEFRDKFVSKDM